MQSALVRSFGVLRQPQDDVSCKFLEINPDYFPSRSTPRNSVSSRGWRSAPRDLTPAQALARYDRRVLRFRRDGPLCDLIAAGGPSSGSRRTRDDTRFFGFPAFKVADAKHIQSLGARRSKNAEYEPSGNATCRFEAEDFANRFGQVRTVINVPGF